MHTITLQEEAMRLRERKLTFKAIADELDITMGEVIELLQDSVHAKAAARRRVPQVSAAPATLPEPPRDQAAALDELRYTLKVAKGDLLIFARELAAKDTTIAQLKSRVAHLEDEAVTHTTAIDGLCDTVNLAPQIHDLAERLSELLGCRRDEISQAVEDLIEAHVEEAERREAAEARIAHVERGRLDAVEELLKARREIRLERERMAAQAPAIDATTEAASEWSAWMDLTQASAALGRVKSVISRAANSRSTPRVAGRRIQVRRKMTPSERATHPRSTYLIRYELNDEEGAP